MFEKFLIEELINFHNHSFTIIDKEERIIHFSKRAEEIFDLAQKDVIGRPITEVFQKDKLVMLKSLRENRTIEKKMHLATPNVYVNIKSIPIIIEGKVEGAIVSEVNVTEEVKQKEEIKKLQGQVQTLSTNVRQLNNDESFRGIIYKSSAIESVKAQIQKAANTQANILITGETGVGKELFARSIHNLSNKDKEFIPINCGAIPGHLFESELFGYEKGAFTGANRQGNKGKIELAQGGTLFLDEIGEMPIDMQVKFLRVLQEKQYFKLGGTKEMNADFRLVSATNKKISDLLSGGDFRSDLLYRINVVNIHIPPLRKRPDDIESLFFYYLYSISEKYGIEMRYADQELLQRMKTYHWPGNVRELINVVERLVIFSNDTKLNGGIFTQYLEEVGEEAPILYPQLPQEEVRLKDFIDQTEADYLRRTLEKHNNIDQASKVLGISRPTLYAKIKKYQL
ncbi:sigma-54 interaction domain-containing protein [Salinicoccus bachuensis]|uniref:Sigma-54 interaction domain-containing protein n=1 Tax=Salinicoccus bachuensis TaxID=3136731 RepID=A0ABZ3CM74_9STAP